MKKFFFQNIFAQQVPQYARQPEVITCAIVALFTIEVVP